MPTNTVSAKKVGFIGLVAFAVSATLGGGIFSLPSSVAQRSCAGIALCAWLLCGFGMFCVVRCFMILAIKKPQLTNGVYTYAEAGFGKVCGFIAAFGYWAASAAAMASYGMLVCWTLSPLVPAFGDGNTWPAFGFCCLIVLCIFLLASRGIKKSAIINTIGTIAKFVPLLVFIVVMIAVFNPHTFLEGLWGNFFSPVGAAEANELSVSASGAAPATATTPLGELMNVSLLTLWVFVGVESAVVFSRDAVNQKTVARATSTAFFILLTLYVLVSLLPFGYLSQNALANLSTPSAGYLLGMVLGPVGLLIVSAGILIAILFGWLVWSQMQAEMPYSLAIHHSFPPLFKSRNAHGACIPGLVASSAFTLLFFVAAILFGDDAWHHIVSLTSTIAGPTYLFATCYLLKLVFAEKNLWQVERSKQVTQTAHTSQSAPGAQLAKQTQKVQAWTGARIGALVLALLGTAYGLFILCSAGWENISFSACMMSVAFVLYFLGTKKATGTISLKPYEYAIVVVIVGLAIAGSWLLLF